MSAAVSRATPARPDTVPARVRGLILIAACSLLLVQVLTLLTVRWVEDESWYSAAAHSLATTGQLRMPVFAADSVSARVDTRPPLAMVIMAGFFRLFGTSLYSAKLPFLLAALVTIPLTFLLGCELRRPWVGLVGAVALATDNFFFNAARTARPEALAAAFAVLGVLVFLYSQRRNSVGLAFLSGLIVGTGSVAHLNAFASALTAGVLAFLEFRWSIVRRPRPWAFVAGTIIPIALFLGWAFSDAVHRAEFMAMYSYGEGYPLRAIPHLEAIRYSDFLGLPSIRVPLPLPVPTRLHIVLALAASAVVLYRYDRELLWKILALLAPAALWWAYERNPSSRYIAAGAPYISLLLAGGLVALFEAKAAWRKATAAVGALLLLSQVGGNYLMLYMYRQADYMAVTRQLRSLIPQGACTYGALTFWMALSDHPYYSWNRTPLQYALDHGATYLILNDRVMVHGSGYGEDDWAQQRDEAKAFVRGHARLIGRAPNPFYGDLEIYRVEGNASRGN
jgi:4-amino-4-deoxy-L-arabinose transferase-like glycosyltransferase